MKKKYYIFPLLLLALACHRKSPVSGNWEPVTTQNGGFQKIPGYEQETAPDMILIEDCAYSIPFIQENSDSLLCNAFYISKYEETNGQYLAYVNYLKRYYSESTYKNALPDTTVWSTVILSNADVHPFIELYFRHPAYRNFPVVGVSPAQIEKYARWKSDRMNEFILIREGIFSYKAPKDSTEVFTTESYLQGKYLMDKESSTLNSQPKKNYSANSVRMEDGILMPHFRLVTSSEWMLAAIAAGDKKHRYARTPTETAFKKYDRDGNFRFLKTKAAKNQSPEIIFSNLMEKIGTVYSGESNYYGVYGLYSGVREIFQIDSLHYGVNKTIENYAAIYTETAKDSGVYILPNTPKIAEKVDVAESGFYGFRLAIDRIPGGYTRPSQKRMKGK